jgi:DNA-directed RNA polymerase specialized sigma subunit
MTNKYDYIDSLVMKAQQGDGRAKEDLCECFRPLVYKLSKTAYETIEYEDMAQTPLGKIFFEIFIISG